MSLLSAGAGRHGALRIVPALTCILIPLTLALSACASGGATAGQRRGCGLQPADSVFAAAGPVYRDCAVDTKAQAVTPNARFDFEPTRGRSGNACYTAEVEFVVNEGGSPETNTARIVHTNDQTFAQAFLTAIATWRYRPAVKAGHPVRQIVDERRSVQTAVVIVPMGSLPPARPPSARPDC